jgi:hypothetical protein
MSEIKTNDEARGSMDPGKDFSQETNQWQQKLLSKSSWNRAG